MESREGANTIVCRPFLRKDSATSRAQPSAERRMPSCRFTTGGLYMAKKRSPRGAPLSSTSVISREVSDAASSLGFPMVADEHSTCGREP